MEKELEEAEQDIEFLSAEVEDTDRLQFLPSVGCQHLC